MGNLMRKNFASAFFGDTISLNGEICEIEIIGQIEEEGERASGDEPCERLLDGRNGLRRLAEGS